MRRQETNGRRFSCKRLVILSVCVYVFDCNLLFLNAVKDRVHLSQLHSPEIRVSLSLSLYEFSCIVSECLVQSDLFASRCFGQQHVFG